MNWLRRAMLIRDVLHRQEEAIHWLLQERERVRLENARNVRDLLENFWIAQEGGIDVREPLLNGLQDLRDEVARLEEHTST